VAIVDQGLNCAGVRIYRPEGELSGAGMLWIHGGGYVVSNVAINDRECARYARDLKITVVSVSYRLAPEHPFPCAMDDCFEAWQWILSNVGDLGVSPDRIVISGQSAGGGLAAGLVQRVWSSTQPGTGFGVTGTIEEGGLTIWVRRLVSPRFLPMLPLPGGRICQGCRRPG